MTSSREVTIQGWLDHWGLRVGMDRKRLVIRDEEVAVFLAGYADMMAMKPCPFPTCEACEEAQRFWWGWCNSIDGPVRVALQRHLRASGIPLPHHPGDDLDVVPTALD